MANERDPVALVARLGAAVPDSVTDVCRTLSTAGHQAVTVGGAVRDALLGRQAGDWDVATSATPEQVQSLFRRTIPTGIDHGTVTVMSGQGDRRMAVEVTTFRGEGDYRDGRRPESVTFGVPLEEDLARRDFVINAMAFDPITGETYDPFGGQRDLDAKVVRAVGVAAERFAEDGLRVMRAVRFAAVLDFALDPDTQAAISGALPTLDQVSRERVWVELAKLLAAPKVERGLELAAATGILNRVAPELGGSAGLRQAFSRLQHVDSDPGLRFGILLVAAEVSPNAARSLCARLTLSTKNRRRVETLTRFAGPTSWRGLSERACRRRMAAVTRGGLEDLSATLEALSDTAADRDSVDRIALIRQRGDALSKKELAVTGGSMISELGISPGPTVGELQSHLLDHVLDDPALNETDTLLDLARRYLEQ